MEVGEPREGGGEEVEGEETEAGGVERSEVGERSWRGVKRKKKKKRKKRERRGSGLEEQCVWCVMAILSHELRPTGGPWCR